MPYSATAVKVMIASPTDVLSEKSLVRDVIAEWNAIYSESTRIVLMPVAWDTHYSPDVTGTPQQAISRQVLAGCDLLIATFWTRIGSPTGKSSSGTVEEIREHIAAGKQAMIYLSSVPVLPDTIDEEQFAALQAFKAECVQKGIWVQPYETLAEYRQVVFRQLALTMIRHFYPDWVWTTNWHLHSALFTLHSVIKSLIQSPC